MTLVSEMSQGEEEMMQEITGIIERILKAKQKGIDHRTELANIILGEDEDNNKVNKLRESIIRYRAYIEPSTLTENPNKKVPLWYTLSNERLEVITGIFENISIPLKQHNELVEKIANEIKGENISVERKIDAILNLLM